MTHSSTCHKHFSHTISKEIAGFLNSSGGDLFIGVKDDKSDPNRIVGLQRDFDWLEAENPGCDARDEWQKIFTNRIRADIGNSKMTNHIIRSEFVSVKNKTIFWVTCKYAGDVRLKKHKRLDKNNNWTSWSKVLFIRIGSSSIPVSRLENNKWLNDNNEEVNEDGSEK